MVAAPSANVASAPSRMATGKVPPSLRPCAIKASPPLFWWKAPWMLKSSRSILSRSCVRNCGRATRSSSTVTWPRTRSKTSAAYSRLVESASVTCRLTAPDLNPIELAFSKLKTHLRQAAARDLEALHSALAAALNSFSPQHCRGFFRHAHYAFILNRKRLRRKNSPRIGAMSDWDCR